MRGLRSFLTSALGVALTGVAAAALVTAAPLAQVAAAAGALLAVVVFAASRSAAPRWFGVRHIVGLAMAALGIVAHWGALIGWSGAAGLADFNGAAASAALFAPERWIAIVEALAAETTYAAGGRVVNGPVLATAWAVGAALIALFGLLGGHSAYGRPRSRL